MADNPLMSSGSTEAVAYALFLGIAQNDGKTIQDIGGVPVVDADAAYILPAYSRCLRTVKGGPSK